MPKRSSKKRETRDEVQTAFDALQHVIATTENQTETPPAAEKNPAAVALGKLGGLKGGHARANALSAKRKAEIARKAAHARWKNNPPKAK